LTEALAESLDGLRGLLGQIAMPGLAQTCGHAFQFQDAVLTRGAFNGPNAILQLLHRHGTDPHPAVLCCRRRRRRLVMLMYNRP
jgi:hypothetical protein